MSKTVVVGVDDGVNCCQSQFILDPLASNWLMFPRRNNKIHV